MNTQRNQKDTVYRMLFHEPENALSLYNSLNGTCYTDASGLEFNTLENAIYMGMKNDLSFLIMDEMHLYEQQSTYTPNMPLRDLFYVADLLQVYTKDEILYSSRKVMIPTPHFVVFYNGTDEIPERMELKLSDAFKIRTTNPELELKVQIFNINTGKNEALKERCPVLKEYMIYVEKLRKYTKTMPINEAVEQAVQECIRDNVLRDFLLRQRAEVVKMSIYEYDRERELKKYFEDSVEVAKEMVRDEVEKEVRKRVRGEIEQEVREEVGKKVRGEIEKEVRGKIAEEIVKEIKEEMQKKLKEEIREEDWEAVRAKIEKKIEEKTAESL